MLTFGGLLGVAQADDPHETTINVVATYSIDSDTFKLVRYSFATNDFMEVGVVQTDSGVVMTDCESLAFVPAGPDIGIYSVPTKGDYQGQMVKIDPLTAIATVFTPTVVPLGGDDDDDDGWAGGRKVTGMTPYFDTADGKWYILAASSENRKSDKNRSETRVLIRIDPSNGTSAIVATKAQLGNGLRFESLGFNSKGDLYATSRTHFFRIHQEAGYWVETIGATGLDKAEAFEVAFGDHQPSITVPGVDPSWSEFGLFIVACENTQQFGVLNPADGSFVEYLVDGFPSTFVMKDAEGIVVVTLRNDPAYGSLAGFD
ncbi:MAG: hypothetical protein ACYTAQ_16595 [Planctomycetota bacterium]